MVQSIIGEISIWEQSGREIFTGSITDNVLIGTKQNTGGEKLYVVGNTKIEGDIEITGEINATINANTINISDNNTNDTFYLTFVDDSGNTKTLNCDKTTTPLTYNPNTGITAVGFTGDGSNLTNLTISNLNGLIPNSKLLNDSITIGTTEIDLGSSNNIISGLITVNSTNFNGTLNGTASVATTLTMTNTSTNVGYYLVFSSSPSTGNNTSYVNANLNYNPSTNTLTGGVFNGTSFSGNANSATTATTASVATTLSLTATTTNVGYYLVFSGSPSTGNSAILVSNTLSYNPSTDVMSCGVVNSNLSGNISTIDATANNSDFLLTSITPTPSTYNQMLYTDITYNPQTKILKVGKIDNCFALTGSGSNLPILFIDHTATGKQFLYNNANFYYNPTLGEFLLQGNTTTQNINCNNLTLTSTDAGSNSDPKLILYRNSASPSINDYIGEIQFKGRNTDPADTIYAKINCVLADASSAGGQSYIETTLLKSGSPILISRQFTTEFQLLNNCGLNVDNYIEAKGHCVIEGDVGIGLAIGSSLTYKLEVYDTTSFHCKNAIRSSDQTLEISSYYQAGVGQYSYLQSRQEATQTNYSHLALNPSGGNVGIGLTNPLVELHIQGNSGAISSNGLDGIVQIATGNTQTANKLCFGVVDDDYSYLQAYKNNSGGSAFAFGDIILNSGGGNVGIGLTNPSQRLDVSGIINYTDRLIGGQLNGANNNHIDCYNSGVSTTRGIYLNYYANTGTGYACYINASPSPRSAGLAVFGTSLFTGFISKSGGGFNIKHPVLGHNYRLVHSFVEAPEASNMYRGKAKLINGTINVNLDKENNMTEGTFIALNTNFNIYVNNNDENSWDMVKGKLNGNILTIFSNNPECNAVIDYLVIGERHDEFMKSDKNDATDCCGKIIVERPATKTECNGCVDKDNEGSEYWKDYYNKENCECIDPYKCYDLH